MCSVSPSPFTSRTESPCRGVGFSWASFRGWCLLTHLLAGGSESRPGLDEVLGGSPALRTASSSSQEHTPSSVPGLSSTCCPGDQEGPPSISGHEGDGATSQIPFRSGFCLGSEVSSPSSLTYSPWNRQAHQTWDREKGGLKKSPV